MSLRNKDRGLTAGHLIDSEPTSWHRAGARERTHMLRSEQKVLLADSAGETKSKQSLNSGLGDWITKQTWGMAAARLHGQPRPSPVLQNMGTDTSQPSRAHDAAL